MDITQNTKTWLSYSIVEDDLLTPGTGLTRTAFLITFAKADGTIVSRAPFGDGFHEVGAGLYRFAFATTELNALGPFVSAVTTASYQPCYRLDDQVVSALGGSQSGFARTIRAELADHTGIPTVLVQVRDETEATVIAEDYTGVSGDLELLLPAATYQVYVWAAGYTFSGQPVEMVVSADGTTTITGSEFAPANPGGPDVVTVYGWMLDAAGVARNGIGVSFTPVAENQELERPMAIESVDKILSRGPIAATTDANGYFELELTPNTDIRPAGTKYLVAFSDTPEDYVIVTIPATTPVNLKDILPA